MTDVIGRKSHHQQIDNLLNNIFFSRIFAKVEEEWLGGIVHLHIRTTLY